MRNRKSNGAFTLQDLLLVEQGVLTESLSRIDLLSLPRVQGLSAGYKTLGGHPFAAWVSVLWLLKLKAGGPGNRQSCFLLETLIMGLLES